MKFEGLGWGEVGEVGSGVVGCVGVVGEDLEECVMGRGCGGCDGGCF